MIRVKKVEDAIKFAQDQLGEDSEFLHMGELERTLSLLAFDRPESSPYSDLLHPAHRQHLASGINEAILKDQFGDGETPTPKLVTLLKLLLWTQGDLENKMVKFTKLTDLAQSEFETSGDFKHVD